MQIQHTTVDHKYPVLLSSNIAVIKKYFIENPVPENCSAMILFAEKECPNILQLIEELKHIDVDFFGGVFPSLVFGNKKCDEGVLIQYFPVACSPVLIKGLDKDKIELDNMDDFLLNGLDISGLILVDGLASNISGFLWEIFDYFGNQVNFIGGGAGSITLKQKPCLFDESGFYQDAAIICPILMESKIKEKHGWKKLQGPLVATKTDKNIIKELNWRNAFEVYKEVVENCCNEIFTPDNFLEIAKKHPFGISRDNDESIVRDPIIVNDLGELICVGEVKENTVLEVLTGGKYTLLDATKQLVKECHVKNRTAETTLVFEGFSRTLVLEDEFEMELDIIQKNTLENKDGKLFGALTLGEIASCNNGSLDFYNKTIVLGKFYD